MQSLNSFIWVCTVNDLLDLCLLIPFETLGLIGTVNGDTNNLINQEHIRGYFLHTLDVANTQVTNTRPQHV